MIRSVIENETTPTRALGVILAAVDWLYPPLAKLRAGRIETKKAAWEIVSRLRGCFAGYGWREYNIAMQQTEKSEKIRSIRVTVAIRPSATHDWEGGHFTLLGEDREMLIYVEPFDV